MGGYDNLLDMFCVQGTGSISLNIATAIILKIVGMTISLGINEET
ncbi:MAG: hypothetical protein VYA59_02100 [Pseudomonadota bacterium]|nr:hypothetical protein [Pseudomonadota bacterium]